MDSPVSKRQRLESPVGISPAMLTKIAEDGDIFVQAGRGINAVKFQVSSAALKLASPVFRAMFGPHFLEGLRTFSASDPLRLEDDDPVAFLEFCRVIHFQVIHRDSLQLNQLAALAVLCDKYQCAQALKHIFIMVLEPVVDLANGVASRHTLTTSELSLSDVVHMAYVIDDPRLFWRASMSAMAGTTAVTMRKNQSSNLSKLVPVDVTNYLDHYRKQFVEELRIKALLLLRESHSKLDSKRRYNRSGDTNLCASFMVQSAELSYQLWKIGLAQGDDIVCLEPPIELLNRFEGLGKQFSSTIAGYNPRCKKIDCRMCKMDIPAAIKKLSATMRKKIQGLCLSCVKEGNANWTRTCETHMLKE